VQRPSRICIEINKKEEEEEQDDEKKNKKLNKNKNKKDLETHSTLGTRAFYDLYRE
jgi:hypothetical protein